MRNTCPSSNGGNLAVGGKRLSCTRAFLLSLPDRLFIHSMFGLRYRVAPHSSETGRRFRAEQAVLIYFVSFLIEVLPRERWTYAPRFSFSRIFLTTRFSTPDGDWEGEVRPGSFLFLPLSLLLERFLLKFYLSERKILISSNESFYLTRKTIDQRSNLSYPTNIILRLQMENEIVRIPCYISSKTIPYRTLEQNLPLEIWGRFHPRKLSPIRFDSIRRISSNWIESRRKE